MFHRRKRGQITVFVILAIVLLFAFMFLLFVKTYFEKSRFATLATHQVQDYISKNSISIYVSSCLDSVTNEALIRATLQGGVFNFTNQTYVSYNVTEYNRTVNIPLVILPNDNCSIVYNYPPEYPYPETNIYPTFFLMNIYDSNPQTCKYDGDIYKAYSGFFGYNKLLRLCNWNGTNRILATNTTYGIKTCEGGTYSNSKVTSIQEEMEHFIEQDIKKCVNFTEILERSPGNISQAGNPKAFITFGDNGFNVRLQYPFNVMMRGRQPIVAFYDFSIDKNVRFKELYDYTYLSILKDSQEAGYNVLDDAIANFGYELRRIKSFDANHTDIIRIIDNSTNIDGKPMIFQLAIKNRRPALEFIHESSGLTGMDVLVAENDTVTMTPQGYDPDDDSLEYNYSLWKEEYDEYFNFSDPQCTTNPSIDYIIENCSIKILDSQPKNFTNSTLFISTKQNASYTTSKNDTGYHELKIFTKEENRQGLEDYQIVKIFVFDKPKANITATNFYDGFPEDMASIEDPYLLNGSGSIIGLSGLLLNNVFSTFVWNDSYLFNEFNKEVAITTDRNKTLYLPLDINGTYDMLNITKLVFANIGVREVSLTVNTQLGFSDTDIYTVNVTACIPYRNSTNPSYPYNAFPDNTANALFANHTCCLDDFTVVTSQSQSSCYTNISYGGNLSFTDLWIREPSPPTNSKTITYIPNNPSWTSDNDNDILKREFIRNCDGTRGNICNGTASETRTVTIECQDNNFISNSAFQDERCSGPPITNNIWTNSPNELSCANYYPGYSFEKYAHTSSSTGGNADGICTTAKQCATANNGVFLAYGGTSGRYACNGLCNSQDGKCSVPVECVCSTAVCSSGGGSDLCNNLPYSAFGQDPLSGRTCIFRNNNYQDECYECGIRDKIVIGKNICSSSGLGCHAHLLCDQKSPFDSINSHEYCDSDCLRQVCDPYNYDSSNNKCYNQCSTDTQCMSGFRCINSQCISI